jgi:hypothetical protein
MDPDSGGVISSIVEIHEPKKKADSDYGHVAGNASIILRKFGITPM